MNRKPIGPWTRHGEAFDQAGFVEPMETDFQVAGWGLMVELAQEGRMTQTAAEFEKLALPRFRGQVEKEWIRSQH